MSADLERAVRSTLRGNLWIDEEVNGLRTEDAVMRVAGAQLKAIAIALSVHQHADAPADGILLNETFTVTDAVMAISGIASLLTNASTMIEESCEEARPATGVIQEAEAAE